MQPQSEQTISRRIHRIEKDLHALTEQHEELFLDVSRQLRHLQSGIDGLVRAAYIDPASLPIDQQTVVGFARHDRFRFDCDLANVEPQVGLPRRRIRPMTFETFVRQDGPNIAIKADFSHRDRIERADAYQDQKRRQRQQPGE